MLFTGRHQHSIDNKGRLSIPAEFRLALQRGSKNPPVLTVDGDCLRLYRHTDFEKHAKRIQARSQVDPSGKDFARHLFMNANATPIDGQGRILVPQYLRQQAHLERDVTVAGVGDAVEIWDTQRLAAMLDQTQSNYRAISTEMADKLGI